MRCKLLLFPMLAFIFVACTAQPSQPTSDGSMRAEKLETTVAEPAATPQLPNLLIALDAQVMVRRQGATQFLPTTLGATVEPGDTLLLNAGEAGIFCGAESEWARSPLSLPLGENAGVSCSFGRPPRPEPNLSGVRGSDNDHSNANELVVLSPRSGFLLNERPDIIWQELSDTTNYTITLRSNEGIDRPSVMATGGQISYPASWPPLEAEGAEYRLIIATETITSDTKMPGFSLLENADAVQRQAAQLRERPVPAPALAVMLAELYLGYKLRSEAVALLTALPDDDELVAVQNLLGEAYLNMGLIPQGQAAYNRMAELAEAEGFIESQAQAAIGLGWIACAMRDFDATTEFWSQAAALYVQHGLVPQAGEVQKLSADMQNRCQ